LASHDVPVDERVLIALELEEQFPVAVDSTVRKGLTFSREKPIAASPSLSQERKPDG
jgi:hypothetical protein